MMKVFVALVVNQYDVMFPEGQIERSPNVYMDILVEPNPKQVVLLKRRQESMVKVERGISGLRFNSYCETRF